MSCPQPSERQENDVEIVIAAMAEQPVDPYGKECTGGRTLQSDTDDANISILIKRVQPEQLTAWRTELRDASNFGDWTDVPDFQTAMEKLSKANAYFQNLPSELRTKLQNNPENLVTYLQDPSNVEEATKYGLFKQVQHQSPRAKTVPKDTEPEKNLVNKSAKSEAEPSSS